jgi:hypothetical protein
LLRDAFARWGLPAQLRVDNGTPWGATGGLPPALVLWLETFPQLLHSGRPYQHDGEEESWDLQRALDRLAEVVEARRVDKVGYVSLYSRNVYVGRSWANQTVFVRYDPQGQRWMFSDERGQLVNHHSAPEISRERIRDLTASDGRTKRAGPT